ncbi:ArsR/SmtB family transcription factor [Amycolatopsis sp. H20-H5]|uniref:ArsR/SmtB family transcription factor n=1 Tax=Amycolatopsis sp. H20-H5 TaxID=3046309 RepID=UPI002DBA251D|nr:metalloregulator ArsR/SmtB family transcription factor [Amycolatopsis sp. H20-H5]MEC3980591.1 metalloregulator ArsR/SmtB family transcription factor [Amycolatopsis sp. H20-H5]
MVRSGRPVKEGPPDLFAALADPVRRVLLERLAPGELSVTELGEGLAVSQAAVSQHLRLLREVGLVEVRQDGRFRRYRLRTERFAELRTWLDELERFWTQRLDALGDYLERDS